MIKHNFVKGNPVWNGVLDTSDCCDSVMWGRHGLEEDCREEWYCEKYQKLIGIGGYGHTGDDLVMQTCMRFHRNHQCPLYYPQNKPAEPAKAEVKAKPRRSVLVPAIIFAIIGGIITMTCLDFFSKEMMFDFIVTNRGLIEGICLIIAGLGFQIFDILRAVGSESEEEFNPIKYAKGLVFVGVMFLVLGTVTLFLDGDFIHGLNYLIAGISLIVYIFAWGEDFRILTIITTLFILVSFLGFGIFSMIGIGITITNVSFIIFGVGLAVFQITDKDYISFLGGIPLLLGTILLGGIFIVDGLTSIGSFVSNFFPDFFLNLNRDFIAAISYIVSGLGIIGLMKGLAFGAFSGTKRGRDIITGTCLIIIGIGFAGLAFVDMFFPDNAHQRVMFAVFSLGLLFGTLCSTNLIMYGMGVLKNDVKMAGNNIGGTLVGFVGLFIEWFTNNEYFFGIGAVFFVVTWIVVSLFNSSKAIIQLVIILLFVLSSLFFGGIFIYSGINILLK